MRYEAKYASISVGMETEVGAVWVPEESLPWSWSRLETVLQMGAFLKNLELLSIEAIYKLWSAEWNQVGYPATWFHVLPKVYVTQPREFLHLRTQQAIPVLVRNRVITYRLRLNRPALTIAALNWPLGCQYKRRKLLEGLFSMYFGISHGRWTIVSRVQFVIKAEFICFLKKSKERIYFQEQR